MVLKKLLLLLTEILAFQTNLKPQERKSWNFTQGYIKAIFLFRGELIWDKYYIVKSFICAIFIPDVHRLPFSYGLMHNSKLLLI